MFLAKFKPRYLLHSRTPIKLTRNSPCGGLMIARCPYTVHWRRFLREAVLAWTPEVLQRWRRLENGLFLSRVLAGSLRQRAVQTADSVGQQAERTHPATAVGSSQPPVSWQRCTAQESESRSWIWQANIRGEAVNEQFPTPWFPAPQIIHTREDPKTY